MKDISVIVPTLNESENIDELVMRISRTFEKYPDLNHEIIFVDDNSSDFTREKILTNFNNGHDNIRLLHRIEKKGLASAVYEGAKISEGKILAVMDADLSHPPESLPELIKPLLLEGKDIVVGSRYVTGGSSKDWSPLRRIMSKTAKIPALFFTEVKDPLSGYFAVKKELLLETAENVPGYKICFEILARGGQNINVCEIPITFTDRQSGSSKTGLKEIQAYCKQLCVLAGAAPGIETGIKFCLAGSAGFVLDFILFNILFYSGFSLGFSNGYSFISAFLLNFILNKKWVFRSSSKSTIKVFFGYGAVALAAFFLRGGLLEIFVKDWHWNASFAGFSAVASGALINYLGNSFITFAQNNGVENSEAKFNIAAAAVIIYTAVLRLVFLGVPELMHQEAYYWNYSQHLSLGYLDHPPMIGWLIHLSTMIFGNNEFAVRFVPYICWIIASYFVFRICSEFIGKRHALKGILLLSVLPGFFCTGFLATPDAPLVAFWAMTLFYLQKALICEDERAWYFAGIGFGLGMLSKYTIILLVPAAFIFIVLNRTSRKMLVKPGPYIAVVISFLIFLPVLSWNASNDWASFIFQGPRRFTSEFDFSLIKLAGAVLLILTPAGFLTFYNMLSSSSLKKIFSKEMSGRKHLIFIFVFTLVPLSVFVFFSMFRQIKLNWTVPLWLAFIPLMAVSINKVADKNRIGRFNIKKIWSITFYTLPLIMGLFLYYSSVGIPGIPYFNDSPFLLGWEEMVKKIESTEENTGDDLIIAGLDKYKIASAVSFYRKKNKSGADDIITGRNLFGKNSLMYNIWADEIQFNEKNIIVLSDNKMELMADSIASHFESLGDIKKIELTKNNKNVKKYFYRVCYGYSPDSDPEYEKKEASPVKVVRKAGNLDLEKLLFFYFLVKDKRIFG
ncbi:MAG: glycosyltransferase family 39 protein [Desulfobacteraceae bacterium]|nr:glycosyltransferase family 39 protein [Desulfobacteraceae bacterium]